MRRSGSQFGLTDQQWDAAKAEVREAILDAAYDRRTTSYGEVGGKVSVVTVPSAIDSRNHTSSGRSKSKKSSSSTGNPMGAALSE